MSTHTVELDASPDAAQIHLQRPAFGIVAALFCVYRACALPLPVLPLFVRDKLGFSNLIVGVVVGIQFSSSCSCESCWILERSISIVGTLTCFCSFIPASCRQPNPKEHWCQHHSLGRGIVY